MKDPHPGEGGAAERSGTRRTRSKSPIHLEEPTFVPMSAEETEEVVRLLADVIKRAVIRRSQSPLPEV